MSVVLSVEETGPCEKQLKIEVPAATVDAETARITAEFRQRVKVPGFRPGKVPAEIVRKRFGDEIEKEVVDRLLPRYWRQAEAEVRLEALRPPAVEDVVARPGEPLVFTATVEVRPEFGLADLENFELPAPPTDVEDLEVERTLEDLRRDLAPWIEVERPAGRGDLVEALLAEVGAGTAAGETAAGDASSGQASTGEESAGEAGGADAGAPQAVAFEVGDANVWEELSLEVAGKSLGQSGTFTRRPESGDEAGAQTYRIEITAVKERDLPPLDDALAARIGKFSTLGELRADLAGRIGGAKARQRRQLRERALLDQLRKRNPATLPRRVLEDEVRSMLTDYAANLGSRGVDPQSAGVDWERLGEQIRPQAEERVHARLLLDAVAERLEIEVPEEVFEATLAALARSQGASAAQLRRRLDADGRLGALRAQLRRERALDRLLGEESTDAKDSIEPPGGGAAEEE